MNLIFCNETCVYQKDGICNLACPAELTSNHVNGCYHFKQRLSLAENTKGDLSLKTMLQNPPSVE